MLKRYTMGFNAWALALFMLIMLPTIIWTAIPAPDDILRAESSTPLLDMTANVCRVVMLFALCAFIHTERRKHTLSPAVICSLISIVLYYAAWVFYYLGSTGTAVILGLTLPPCLAFIFYTIDRRNIFALVPAVIFTVCHMAYGVVNYIL